MSTSILAIAVLGPTAVVIAALFLDLWSQRTSSRESRIALASAGALAMWAAITTALARRAFFEPAAGETVPPLGLNLVVVLLALALCLAVSTSLRGLLFWQVDLIRRHLWRFDGIVFLILMARGRVPALWALPAGNPGRTPVFNTPTSEMLTRFQLAPVPAFPVPLAFSLHLISLWQLLGGKWGRPDMERRGVERGPTIRRAC
jgi:hypothetical protein